MKQIIRAFLLNVFLPLILGLCIYLFFYKGTYINLFFNYEPNFYFTSIINVFVKSWLCDILWAYSLTYALYFVLFAFSKRTFASAIISICIATIFEMLQLFGIVAGTFDVLDIFFQILAVIIAVVKIKRREIK